MQLKSISARWVIKTKTVLHFGVMVIDMAMKNIRTILTILCHIEILTILCHIEILTILCHIEKVFQASQCTHVLNKPFMFAIHQWQKLKTDNQE